MRDARVGVSRIRRAAAWRVGMGLGACLVLCAMAAAHEASPSRTQVAQWASSCVTCHGASRAVEGSIIPSLAGRPAAEIERQMQAFAAGRRAGLLMQQIAKGYDARMIRAIAQWYAQRVPEKP